MANGFEMFRPFSPLTVGAIEEIRLPLAKISDAQKAALRENVRIVRKVLNIPI